MTIIKRSSFLKQWRLYSVGNSLRHGCKQRKLSILSNKDETVRRSEFRLLKDNPHNMPSLKHRDSAVLQQLFDNSENNCFYARHLKIFCRSFSGKIKRTCSSRRTVVAFGASVSFLSSGAGCASTARSTGPATRSYTAYSIDVTNVS